MNTQPIESVVSSRKDGKLEVVKIWRDVLGWEGLYEVSDQGDVRSLPRTIIRLDGQGYTIRGGLLKQTPAVNGKYRCVCLCNNGSEKWSLVHTLVLQAFVGPCPPGKQCRHKNGDGSDNRLRNLKWGTPLKNAEDRDRHGRTQKGSKHTSALLTENDVREIKRLISKGWKQRLIAKSFGVHPCTICDIKYGRTWSHL